MSTTATLSSVETASVTPAALPPPGQPDIAYAPDREKWQARVARRLAQGGLTKSLPEGFPQQLEGDLVWEGQTLAEKYAWTYVLSEAQLAEIDAAVEHFKSLNLTSGHVSSKTFPLPTLHAELRRLSRELHRGHGFFVLRGLQPDKYSRADNVLIYTGISSHIADKRGRQDHKFNGAPADVVLTHIKDLSEKKSPGSGNSNSSTVIGSPAYTTDRQVFHTDSGDIVSLFALETALHGGASKLASTWRVYNEIARTRPDLIHTLAENWDVEVFDHVAGKEWSTRPLVFHQPASPSTPERVILQYARRYFVGFGALPRSHNIPPITEAQAEALDTLHFLGEKFCVNTSFEKGDIQYVNNLAVFHARDGFVDGEGKHRHLLRLWLRDSENAWPTPEVLQPRWEQLYDGVTPEASVLPLEPYIRSASNKAR
ncbi:TfdA family taurine catabolism dioxygenase TauD [Microdochium trichocladiopsis]|uniref:TfdA family taurine catabolism dioxygenase TauD n=1 Tax=Microdochium trichocladiopsis TaxID=1682393 RepID=A0A9P9BL81_9PEZI|nr:TfdA family taurine catabolism dioxygenase TauD [Microdochium trichocladiopsis]KAH7024624.1 TfdA family taurine catabolism dioxygenase TauD [Microdochium trichocladiopsis]